MRSVISFEVRGPNIDTLLKAATKYYNDVRPPGEPSEERMLPADTTFDIKPVPGPGTSEHWNPPVIIWEAVVIIQEDL